MQYLGFENNIMTSFQYRMHTMKLQFNSAFWNWIIEDKGTELTSCILFCFMKKQNTRTSLVVQWLRICLPMQRTWVQSLVQEDSMHCGVTKAMHHVCGACALEPKLHSENSEQPTHHSYSSLYSLQPEKARAQQWRPWTAKDKINYKLIKK